MKLLKVLFLLAFFSFQFGKAKAQISDTVKVYPNPFNSETNVCFTLIASDTVTIIFYNRWGRTVLQPMTNQILAAGLHIINIQTDSISQGSYFWRVDFGSSIKKVGWAIKSNSITSISQNIDAAKSFVLFPNPTSDLLSISGEGLKEIRISDLSGKEWQFFKTNLNQISLKELPNGMYNIQISDRDKKLILRENILKVD